MILAFCLFRYLPFSGLAGDMLRIAQCARLRGHDVTIFTSEWQGERAGGVQIEVLPAPGITNHGRAASYCRRLSSRLEDRFDAVVGFNKMPGLDVYYAADACFAARARYGRHPLYRLTPRYRGYRRLEQAVFSPRARTHILALSENAVSEYREFYRTGDSRFTLLPPTLQERFRSGLPGAVDRARVRNGLDLSEDSLMVLMVGSGFRTKGVDRAVLSVASLPGPLRRRVRLVIAGSGAPGPYRSMAEQAGIAGQISFLGGRDDVPELMAAADVLLHPAYNENTGTVLLEAMAVGLPVLTTSVCGYARYVTAADAGLVVGTPFEQEDLNRALLGMLTADGSDWRRNGPRYVRQPAFFALPDKALDAIEEAVHRRGQPGPVIDGGLYLSDELGMSGHEATLDSLTAIEGEIYREAPGRRTVRFTRGGKGYFMKTHSGAGWGEILKNLVSLKLPVLGAQNEWHALHYAGRLGVGVPRPLGFGTRGRNPARRQSLVIMNEVAGGSLEKLCASDDWAQDVLFKRTLIALLAGIARTLHLNGANHRDFYLCHFLLRPPAAGVDSTAQRRATELVLIDLHRMQIRRRTPMRWIVKDLGGLYFSAMDATGLTSRDLYRFIVAYSGKPLRAALAGPVDWRRVRNRAMALRRGAA